MATYAIVHSSVSKMMRRVIADDDGLIEEGLMPDGVTRCVICHHANGAPSSLHPLLPGESVLIENAGGPVLATSHHDWRRAIMRATGVDPPVITCAIIDKGVVAQIIHADPDVDASPSQLPMVKCYSPVIIVGCTYDDATGLFTMPEGLLPPHTPGNDTDEPITVPPAVILKPEP